MNEAPELSLELNPQGFIVDQKGKIFGRVGQPGGDGTAWYQIAGSPYDWPSVMGLKDKDSAFAAACSELQTRRLNS